MTPKFRAYDKNSGSLIYADSTHWFEHFDVGWHLVANDELGPRIVCGQTDRRDDGVLMRATGLVDRNGTQIYEGDIVQKDVLDKRGIVLWFAPTYAGYIIFHPKNGYIPNDWHGSYNELDGRHGAFGSTHKIEVVGNVYQNPELLEPAA